MQVGELIAERYLLDRPIGEGSFGEIWAARDAGLGHRGVALKFLKLQELEKIPEKYRAEMLARFEREATALAAVSHPNLVTVFERGKIPGGTHYIVMELVEGETLRQWLDRFVGIGEAPKLETVCAIFDQICQGVAALHGLRVPGPVVHRDLKSNNVMLIRQGPRQWLPKVLDLGVARVGERRETHTGLMLGTLANMAPEQGTGNTQSVSPATDVFALGVMLVEMVTGHEPPEGGDAWWVLAMRDESALRDRLRAMLPPALADVAARAMRTQPQDRFADAGALRAALQSAVPSPESLRPATVATSPRTGAAAVWAAVAVLSAAIVGGTVYAVARSHREPAPTPTSIHVVDAPTHVGPSEVHAPVNTPREPCPINAVTFTGAAFRMGDPTLGTDAQEGANDEGPLRDVTLSDYRLDRTDVTVECFRRYWHAGHPAPSGQGVAYPGGAVLPWEGVVFDPAPVNVESCTWSESPGGFERHPINCVSWATSQAYCAWVGGRLPTEAEWEYAARGETGSRYPWGDDAPDAQLCWSGGRAPVNGTCEVESHSAGMSRRGVFDLAGNVWNWVADRYAYRYEGPTRDPLGTSSTIVSRRHGPAPIPNRTRVIRGGSWMYAQASAVRSTMRIMADPDQRLPTIGFRCAYSAAAGAR